MSHNLHLSDPDAEWLKVSTLVPPPAEFTLDRVKTLRELTKPPPPSAVDDRESSLRSGYFIDTENSILLSDCRGLESR